MFHTLILMFLIEPNQLSIKHCQIADETKILQIYKIKMIDTSGQRQEPMHLVLNEDDLAYEEEILRNPHSIKPWIRYIGKQELL